MVGRLIDGYDMTGVTIHPDLPGRVPILSPLSHVLVAYTGISTKTLKCPCFAFSLSQKSPMLELKQRVVLAIFLSVPEVCSSMLIGS